MQNSTESIATSKKEAMSFQDELTTQYMNPEESPLGAEKIPAFEEKGGHKFYDIDPKYRVEAKFKRVTNTKDIKFKTSTDRLAVYDLYGVAKFKLDGEVYKVNVYQSHRSREMEEYKNHLFLPFKDYTNGEGSYGGGRYIDLRIPNSNKIMIDFNKAYNPYCAYSDKYSCPVPPRENHMKVEIKAGVKSPK